MFVPKDPHRRLLYEAIVARHQETLAALDEKYGGPDATPEQLERHRRCERLAEIAFYDQIDSLLSEQGD